MSEPKFPYKSQVYIKKGFYRGYKATVESFTPVTIKNQETGEEENYNLYKIKIDGVTLKELYEIKEDWMILYKKYILF